jgi:hypothetical protein
MKVSTTDTMSAINFEIIDLDAHNLPSNDRDIYEVVQQHMLADPVELEVEASESAVLVAVAATATSAHAVVPANEEPTSGATAAGQLTPGQAKDVRGLMPLAASEAADEVHGELAAGTELTLVVPSPLTARVDSAAAEAPGSLSPRSAAPIYEAAPTANTSLTAPQEHDALRSVARASSPEFQETGEGSGAVQLPELEKGDAWIFDLARFSWATAFEADASAGEDEESAACHTLERGLLWARRAFDKLILPTTMVSPLDVVAHSCLFLLLAKFMVDVFPAWNRHSRSPTGGGRVQLASSEQKGPSW